MALASPTVDVDRRCAKWPVRRFLAITVRLDQAARYTLAESAIKRGMCEWWRSDLQMLASFDLQPAPGRALPEPVATRGRGKHVVSTRDAIRPARLGESFTIKQRIFSKRRNMRTMKRAISAKEDSGSTCCPAHFPAFPDAILPTAMLVLLG
jgi:hypothetical protein